MNLPNNGWEKIFDEIDVSFLNEIEKLYDEGRIFPDKNDLFKAFKLCDYSEVKVVILGQDPYHTEGVADGLCFSSKKKGYIPPSLKNIFRELESDLKINRTNGSLEDWAKQGILLINTVLTVEANKPLSHKNMGWEIFVDKIIEKLSLDSRPIIFVLWGENAKNKKNMISYSNNYIIESSHPSFFSYKKGFEGSKPFSKINEILKNNNQKEIEW